MFAGNLVLTDIKQNDNNKAAIMALLNTVENFLSATTECKGFSVRAQTAKSPSPPECLIKYPVNLKVNSSVKGFSPRVSLHSLRLKMSALAAVFCFLFFK